MGLLAAWLVVLALPAGAADLPDTIERIKPSIVGIGTVLPTRRPPGKFVGTGFVVGDGRHVVTNAHVLPQVLDTGKKEFLAVLTGGEEEKTKVRKAEVVSVDRDHDVALLRFAGRPLSPMHLGDARRVREGQRYAFTGFPIGIVLGMRPVTHRGIVSAITPIAIPQLSSRQLDAEMIKRLEAPYNVFQLDATAYPGNSGSPLYDPGTGEVVGVVNKVFVQETKEHVLDRPSGISYAIPITYAEVLMRKAGLATN